MDKTYIEDLKQWLESNPSTVALIERRAAPALSSPKSIDPHSRDEPVWRVWVRVTFRGTNYGETAGLLVRRKAVDSYLATPLRESFPKGYVVKPVSARARAEDAGSTISAVAYSRALHALHQVGLIQSNPNVFAAAASIKGAASQGGLAALVFQSFIDRVDLRAQVMAKRVFDTRRVGRKDFEDCA